MRWSITPALALTVFMASTPTPAITSGQTDVDPKNLILRTGVQKKEAVLYQWVVVNYSVENPTNRPIKSVLKMNYREQSIAFWITNPEGATYRFNPGAGVDGIVTESPVGPGKILHSQVEMGINAFPRPGKYHIDAKMAVGPFKAPAEISAGPIALEVFPPSGKDAAAISFFDSKEAFLLLNERGPVTYCEKREVSNTVCFQELGRFCRTNSESVYTPFVMWNLAESIASGNLKVKSRYDTATGLMRRFLETWPDHSDAPRVMYRLASVLNQAGKYEEAVAEMNALEARFPDRSDLVQSLRGLLQRP